MAVFVSCSVKQIVNWFFAPVAIEWSVKNFLTMDAEFSTHEHLRIEARIRLRIMDTISIKFCTLIQSCLSALSDYLMIRVE